MDLNHLNPSQIVLLTLLVSFVTSIATGIVTVTLMEQAPPTIAQTVNRVVERTVEKVVPSGQAAGAAVTEKTVVVTESDLIAKAVKLIGPSVVRLYAATATDEGSENGVFLGFGLVVDGGGTIVTDIAVLPSTSSIVVTLADGSRATATLASRDDQTGIAVLQGEAASTTDEIAWTPAALAQKDPTLGEVVFGVSGKSAMRIGDGIITAVSTGGGTTTPAVLETNVPAGAIAYGSVLVNVQGEIEGISTKVSRTISENSFVPSDAISAHLAAQSTETEDESTE